MRSQEWNDCVSQWFCAWPVFTDTIPYRHYHLVHHRKTQQPDDPDLHLSAKFPITKESFRRKMIRDITGQTGFKLRARINCSTPSGRKGMPFARPRAEFLEAARHAGRGESHSARDSHRARQAALLFHVLAVAAADMAAGHHAHPQHRRTRHGAGQ